MQAAEKTAQVTTGKITILPSLAKSGRPCSRASFTLDVYTHLFDEQRANSAVSMSVLLGSQGPRN